MGQKGGMALKPGCQGKTCLGLGSHGPKIKIKQVWGVHSQGGGDEKFRAKPSTQAQQTQANMWTFDPVNTDIANHHQARAKTRN